MKLLTQAAPAGKNVEQVLIQSDVLYVEQQISFSAFWVTPAPICLSIHPLIFSSYPTLCLKLSVWLLISASLTFFAPPLLCVCACVFVSSRDQQLREVEGRGCVYVCLCVCRSVSGRVRVLCDAWMMSQTPSSQASFYTLMHTHSHIHTHTNTHTVTGIADPHIIHTTLAVFLTSAPQLLYLYTLDPHYWRSPRITTRTPSLPPPF